MTRIADHLHAFDADDDRIISETSPGVIGVILDDRSIVRVVTERTKRENTTYGTLPVSLAVGPWPHLSGAIEHVRDDDTVELYAPLAKTVTQKRFRDRVHEAFEPIQWVERADYVVRTTDAEPKVAVIFVLSDQIAATGKQQVSKIIENTGWVEETVQPIVNELLLSRQQEIRRQLNEQ